MFSLAQHFSSLGFIGTGNMATAILKGTVGCGRLDGQHVFAFDIDTVKLDELAGGLKIQPCASLKELLSQAQFVVLAVKPQQIKTVLTEIAPFVTPAHCLLSIAAGSTLQTLASFLPQGTRLIRVMPNTPALVGEGAAGVAPGPHATEQDLLAALALFESVGVAAQVKEEDLDAVTALSGSGPAYVFRLMELMIEAGQSMGLEPEVARQLTLQTVKGAAALAIQSAEAPSVLRRKVTSPGGTTQAALETFEAKGLADTIHAGLIAARDRSVELSKS